MTTRGGQTQVPTGGMAMAMARGSSTYQQVCHQDHNGVTHMNGVFVLQLSMYIASGW